MRQQRLFAAGVGALDLSKLGRRIVSVDSIDENHARLTVSPGRLDDSIQNLTGVGLSDDFARSRIDQVVALSLLDLFHECIGDSDRYVEGVQLERILFCGDKLFD